MRSFAIESNCCLMIKKRTQYRAEISLEQKPMPELSLPEARVILFCPGVAIHQSLNSR